MSWVVEITHVPVADTLDEAWDQLDELREEESGREYGAPPSEPLRQLYERLTAKFPCILVDSDSPWSDGPLINNFGDKLATIGIVVSQMEEALPFVIDTATGMGMTVFDAGDEQIHRPKGWRPPVESVSSAPIASASSAPTPRKPWWRFW